MPPLLTLGIPLKLSNFQRRHFLQEAILTLIVWASLEEDSETSIFVQYFIWEVLKMLM